MELIEKERKGSSLFWLSIQGGGELGKAVNA